MSGERTFCESCNNIVSPDGSHWRQDECALRVEVERLTRERDEAIAREVHVAKSAAELLAVYPHVGPLSAVLRPLFEAITSGNAPNFVTVDTVFRKDGAEWTVTAQRKDGRTPAEHIGALTRERDEAVAFVRSVAGSSLCDLADVGTARALLARIDGKDGDRG